QGHGYRRHGGRRVRQRHAAVAANPSRRRVQSSTYFHRPGARPGGLATRTPAPIRTAPLLVGGLLAQTHLEGRRHLYAQLEEPELAARSSNTAGFTRDFHAERGHQ